MEFQIRLAGLLLVALACLHGVFPYYFKWKENFKSLPLIDREVMYIHTLFIAITVGLMGVLCIAEAPDLVNTPLGKKVCMGLGIFWAFRLAVQFWGYSPELWRGKKKETSIHVLFVILWTYFTILFVWTGF